MSAVLFLLVAFSCAAQTSQAEDAVYYLLRHAEKEAKSDAADPKNPGLTVEGQARAQALVRFLEQEELTGILST
ncbi:MAG: phosphoglycerate mutase, partial [Candidatus Eisenbacteria bacterium]|nr:phosphoglycerate mutase [Candidatus Eisenbacteria bacterium]